MWDGWVFWWSEVLNGRLPIAETSTKEKYKPTLSFYGKNGFVCEAIIEGFCEPDDGKAMYVFRGR